MADTEIVGGEHQHCAQRDGGDGCGTVRYANVDDGGAGHVGGTEVRVVTECAAAAYPECGAVSDRVHETVVARPQEVRRAGDTVALAVK